MNCNSAAFIEFRDVNYTPHGAARAVLEGINFSVTPGQSLALLGESGCGKTTTLRLINRLLLPSSGAVFVEGKNTRDWDELELRRHIGYVIQEGGLFPHLTARQNVLLLARHIGQEESKNRARFDALCELTHFPTDHSERFPGELSGGQRQRVGLMRALMLDPPLLLFDEPLAALDPMVRASLQTDLKRIFQTLQKTVVVVTHDLGEAGFLGDEIALMRNGKILQQGAFEELRETPADPFVTEFISAQRPAVTI
jgi:osmoprotectant transport system ATP-binding protein